MVFFGGQECPPYGVFWWAGMPTLRCFLVGRNAHLTVFFGGQECLPYGGFGGQECPPYGVFWWAGMPTLRRFWLAGKPII